MKQILRLYTRPSLILRILAGLLLGAALGLLLPDAAFLSLFGTLFVGALKAVAPILVLVLVTASLANAGAGLGRRFQRVIFLYLLSTFLAAFAAVLVCHLFPITVPLAEAAEQSAPMGLSQVFANLLSSMVENPVSAVANANYIGILTWSVILGLALRKGAGASTKALLSDLSDAVSKTVAGIVQLSPFGIMGLVFSSVHTYGLHIFTDYGKLLLLLITCMLASAFVINPALVALFLRRNPYPLVLRCLRESGVMAFFTRSSAANIPVNMALCEKLGLDREYYSVSIPLGATVNMNGAAVTITVMALTAAFSSGLSVHFLPSVLLSFLATLGACGASGVAGGSLLLIPMACSLLGVGQDVAMQMVGVGFIIGVIQDALETAVNSSGDVIFAATAEYMDYRKHNRPLPF